MNFTRKQDAMALSQALLHLAVGWTWKYQHKTLTALASEWGRCRCDDLIVLKIGALTDQQYIHEILDIRVTLCRDSPRSVHFRLDWSDRFLT